MAMLLDALGWLAGTLPILGGLLLLRAANVRKDLRVRQFPMPIVAIVYAIVAMVVLYRFNSLFDELLALVFRWAPLLRDWYDTRWLTVIENTIVVVVFLLIKLALKPLLSRMSTVSGIPARIVEPFYGYDEDYGVWFVRERLGNLRRLYSAFFWGAVIVAIATIVLVKTFPAWAGFQAVAAPTVIALVLGEFAYFLDGLTRREYRLDVLGEEDVARRVANYGPLRSVLRETFPGRVLTDDVRLSSTDALNTFSLIDELRHAESDVERLAGGFFERIKQAGHRLDWNLVDASVGLLRGRSTVISNPFYADLTPYLGFPAHYHLLQQRKVLVIAGRDTIAEDLVDWMRSALESITGIPELWSSDLLREEGRDGLDVGVLRFADIHNLELIKANDEFIRSVGYVILAEPSRMLATGQLGIGLVLGRAARGGTPVYAAFDSNHDGLVDALSHLLKTELTDVVASAMPSGVSSEVVWRANGPHMHGGILPTISRYLGMGTEIGAVALKYQVAKATWVGSDSFPVNDMAWIAGQYYAQINAFADLQLSQSALEEAIVPASNPWGLEQERNSFLIVEDELSNLYESMRLYSTRAREQGFLNLIAEDYLLRDYMVGNRRIFAADPKAIPSIVPDFARTERNSVLRLILALVAFEVSDVALGKEFELIGRPLPRPAVGDAEDDGDFDDGPLLALLRELITKHTGVAEVEITTIRRSRTVELPEGVHRLYRIAEGTALDEVIDQLRSAYFFVEDEVEDANYIGALLYGHVYQSLLPGQFITYGGKYYEVQSIGTSTFRNGVVLRRAAEHIRDRRVYRALRTFALTDLEPSESVGARLRVGDVELERSFATIRVTTSGYLEQPSRSDLVAAHRVEVDAIPDRELVRKELLEIRLPAVPPAVRRTIAALLGELFVTLFPHSHQYVVALTEDAGGSLGVLLDGLEAPERTDSIFIVEDSLVDLGLIVAVERNWRRLFEIITDYLLWQGSEEQAPEAEAEPVAPAFPVAPPKSPGALRRWLRRLWDAIARRSRGIDAPGLQAAPEPGPQPGSEPELEPEPESESEAESVAITNEEVDDAEK